MAACTDVFGSVLTLSLVVLSVLCAWHCCKRRRRQQRPTIHSNSDVIMSSNNSQLQDVSQHRLVPFFHNVLHYLRSQTVESDRAGLRWIGASYQAVFQLFAHIIQRTLDTVMSIPRRQSLDRPPPAGDDVISAANKDGGTESHDNRADDVMSTSDVNMTYTDDVTSYSLLSADDVTQLYPVIDDDDNGSRLSIECREIRRDLVEMREYAREVSARCHDNEWRRGDALTFGVTEALTPYNRHIWTDASALNDWRLDESAFDDESRDCRDDVIVSAGRKLSLTCTVTDCVTSSLGDASVADIYIDDEVDDVIG